MGNAGDILKYNVESKRRGNTDICRKRKCIIKDMGNAGDILI